jgi:predicted RNase H-like HicB family nuclease
MKARLREKVFNVVVEKDEDGYYVASVVELPGCHTQAKSLDQLRRRLREAIEGYLQAGPVGPSPEFIGVQQLRIAPGAP